MGACVRGERVFEWVANPCGVECNFVDLLQAHYSFHWNGCMWICKWGERGGGPRNQSSNQVSLLKAHKQPSSQPYPADSDETRAIHDPSVCASVGSATIKWQGARVDEGGWGQFRVESDNPTWSDGRQARLDCTHYLEGQMSHMRLYLGRDSMPTW